MNYVAVSSQLVLAIVFAVSGAAKLVDRAGSRQALAEFGVPPPLLGSGVLLLPLAELLVVGLLIVEPWWGGLGAFALLGSFTLVVAVVLVRGLHPRCHCFGRLSERAVGWPTVWRNAVLMVAATVVMTADYRGAWIGIWADVLSVSGFAFFGTLAAVVPIAVLSRLSLLLWRQQGRLLLRIEALEQAQWRDSPAPVSELDLTVGEPAPNLRGETLVGSPLDLRAILDGTRPVLLAFTDAKCNPCTALLPRLEAWQRELEPQVRVVVVHHATSPSELAEVARYGFSEVFLQSDFEAADSYHLVGTPSAVLVTADGRLGSAVVSGEHAIAELIAQSARAAV